MIPISAAPNFIIKGQVYLVKADLNFFKVVCKNDVTINRVDDVNAGFTHYRVYSVSGVMPVEGDEVTIISPKKMNRFYLLLPETEYNFPRTTDYWQGASLWGLLDRYPPKDLHKEYELLDRIINQLKGFVTNIDDLINCLWILYKQYYDNLNPVTITVPKELRKVHENSEPYQSVVNFTTPSDRLGYMVQQYPSSRPLVGIMKIGEPHYNMILEDHKFWVFVKFIAGPKDPYVFASTYVIVKEYTLVVEIYQDKKRPTLFYILVHESDVIPWKALPVDSIKYVPVGEHYSKFKNFSCDMVLTKKAQTIVGYAKNFQCWLEVKLLQHGSWMIIYLILPEDLCEVVPLLKEYHKYKIYSEVQPSKTQVSYFKEIKLQGNTQIPIYVLHKNSVFHEMSDTPEEGFASNYHVQSYQELVRHMREAGTKSMFDITLKIDHRKIELNKMTLFCPRRHQREPFFGTGSNLQEKITFKGDSGCEWPIDMYMRNQENQPCHLGLEPGATVKLTNVLSMSGGRYLMPTIFTTMEVIKYERPVYCSANLQFKDFDMWDFRKKQGRDGGPSLYMSPKVPANTLTYAQVIVRAVLGLTLEKLVDKPPKFNIVLEVQQARNTFIVESSYLGLLADLIGLESISARTSLLDYCSTDGIRVVFDSLQAYNPEINEPGQVFTDMTLLLVECINYNLNPTMEVLLLRQGKAERIPYRILRHHCYPFF